MRVCVRMYARAYDCQDSTSGTSGTHTNGTHDHRKGRTQAKRKNLFIYVCLQALKKSIKKVKKNLVIKKNAVPLYP